jgi:hypothetical protein
MIPQTPYTPPPRQAADNEDITLKEIVLKIRELLVFFLSKSWVLALFALLGGVLGFGYAHFTRSVTYESRLSFAIEEKSSPSGIAGFASQFGLDVEGGNPGLFSSGNISTLLQSDRIVQAALLCRQDHLAQGCLANLYLERINEKKRQGVAASGFVPGMPRDSFGLAEESLLRAITNDVKQKIAINREKTASFIDLTVTDTDEDFAWRLSGTLLREAIELYTEIKVGRLRRSISLLESRQDSLQRLMISRMASVAASSDRSLGILQTAPLVGESRRKMELELLTALYAEVSKNLELSKFSLQQTEPVIEKIDIPYKPLKVNGKGRARAALVFSMAFLLVGAIYVFVQKEISE